MSDKKHRTQAIAHMNDELRMRGRYGRWVFSAGVSNLPRTIQSEVIQKIRTFEDFDEHGNDPYGEHDFGKVTVDVYGAPTDFFWKIDYLSAFDGNSRSPDPARNDVTQRILTVMLAEEY